MPKRIQRKRVKNWRMPEGAVYVGRPTKWGNEFKVGDPHPVHGWPMSAQEAVDCFRADIDFQNSRLGFSFADIQELEGKDLVCWCSLDQPCHADVLLELAKDAKIPARFHDLRHTFASLAGVAGYYFPVIRDEVVLLIFSSADIAALKYLMIKALSARS